MLLSVLVNNKLVLLSHPLFCMPLDWVMLKPMKMGSEQMEAQKADCVKQPNVSWMKVRVARPASCPHIVYKSCCAIFPGAGTHSC